MIKNVDPVGGSYRGEPVGDDQGAAAAQHLVQRGEQLVLGPRIEGSRRLVDDHQRRIAIERARNRHLLPLAAGELVSAYESRCQRCLVSGRQRRKKRVGISDLRRLADRGMIDFVVRSSHRNVLLGGERVPDKILEDDRYPLPE